MKEFMTQDELIGEFVEYLDGRGLVNVFRNSALGLDEDESYRTLTRKYEEMDTTSFLRFCMESKILDLGKLTNTLGLTSGATMALCIWSDFRTHFNSTHKKEIHEQMVKAAKIMVRYTREIGGLRLIDILYGGREKIIGHMTKIGNPYIYSTFPLALMNNMHLRVEVLGDYSFGKGFIDYYESIIEE